MLMFVVAGCESPTSPKAVLPKSAAADQILVSSQPLLEMAQAVAAETFPVAKIVSDSVSSRYWKPTREEARTLQKARLILINGAGYEPWTARLSLPDSRLIDTAAGYYDQLVRIPDAVTYSPSNRSAAFSITPGSVLMPTVKVDGVLTRMFCCESAPRSAMSMASGVRHSAKVMPSSSALCTSS